MAMILLKKGRLLEPLTHPWPGLTEVEVLVEDGLIKEVAEKISLSTKSGAVEVDLKGGHLLPGLIDLHVHLDNEGIEYAVENRQSDSLRALKAAMFARRTLAAGFTTIRDCGGRNLVNIDLREAIATGYATGPRLLACGRVLTSTAIGNDEVPGMYREADGAEEVRKATREQLAAGADFIKYMGTGSIGHSGSEPGSPTFNYDEVEVMVQEAAKLGRTVAAHAHGTIGIKHALRAGVRTIEHASILDDECLEILKSGNSFIVPTLSAAQALFDTDVSGNAVSMKEKSRWIIETLVDSISRAYKQGLKIGYGTDVGTSYNQHGSNFKEFLWRRDLVGMNPLDILKQATCYNAEILGMADRLGMVTPGFIADLIAVNGDPTADISVMTRPPALVMLGGSLIHMAPL